MKVILSKLQGDKVIWFVVAALSLFSILAVYSSTGTLAYRFQAGNTEYYLFKHFVILVSGLGLMFLAHRIKYTYYAPLSRLAIIIAVPLLAITLFSGTNINEANRWITLPVINITFQSSDFAKLALIMYLARALNYRQENIKDFTGSFIPILLPVLIVTGLILPANLSTAMILFATSIVLMFVGRISMKYIFSLIGIGVVLLSIFIIVLLNSPDSGRLHTWKARIERFTNPDTAENYQSDQAKIAIATGGIAG
ncbi:MAG: FtsW/RodA/SpoVE family cell cycle protein, partial [Bacteroidota bacterium]